MGKVMTVRTKYKRKIKIYYHGVVQGNSIMKSIKSQLADNDDYNCGRISVDKCKDGDDTYICVYVFCDAKRIPKITI